jgi:hypothetical protein
VLGAGAVRGSALDPSGSAIPGAAVEIFNPVSQFSKTAITDAQGHFEIDQRSVQQLSPERAL